MATHQVTLVVDIPEFEKKSDGVHHCTGMYILRKKNVVMPLMPVGTALITEGKALPDAFEVSDYVYSLKTGEIVMGLKLSDTTINGIKESVLAEFFPKRLVDNLLAAGWEFDKHD